MLVIEATSIAQAWEKSFLELYHKGNTLDDPEILKDETLILEISNPIKGERFHSDFPMPKDLLNEYNKYIVRGGSKGNVQFEHALYYERLFAFPPNKNNQIQAIIKRLKDNPYTKRAQATLWYPDIDQEAKKVPCLQVLWCRIENKKLVMHTHMRANDGYKKLLMNLNIFVEIMNYISKELQIEPGHYIHFVDSFHLYKENKEEIKSLVKKLEK